MTGKRRRGEGFVWIGRSKPDSEQIKGIAETFGLHDLARSLALSRLGRPASAMWLVLFTRKRPVG